jgi:hypothetical protein
MSRSRCLPSGQRRWTLDFTRPPLFALISLIILSYCCSFVHAVEDSFDNRSGIAEGNMVGRWDKIILDRQYPQLNPRDAWDRRSDASSNDIDVHVLVTDDEDEWDTDEESVHAHKRSSSSSSGSASANSPSSSPFPSPFETLANNFTSASCPQFFANFLSNSTFKSCYAISLLLQNSQAFFHVAGSAVSLDQVVQTSCSANATKCSTYMSQLASDLIGSSACGQDYNLGNSVVMQAYAGMIAYAPIYHAACLKDPATENFCFTEAATNDTNVTDYYVYFLPLGMPLPGSSRPTCNACLQATMEVFQQSALIKGQPLTQTYIPAAEQINIGCGPGFVNDTVKVGSKAASAGRSTRGDPPAVTFLGSALLLGMAFWIL